MESIAIITNWGVVIPQKQFTRYSSNCLAETLHDYIGQSGIKAHLIDAGQRDTVVDKNELDKHSKIILLINEDNILNFLSFMKSNKRITDEKFILTSLNVDLSSYIPENIRDNYFNLDERAGELRGQIDKISNRLGITPPSATFIMSISRSSDKTHTMCVNTGEGAARGNSFSSISNSHERKYNIPLIVEEIKKNIIAGSLYFHINSHNFSSDFQYVKDFCGELKVQCSGLDFKWSCFIIPEIVAENLEILGIMKDANLDRIEIGLENINPIIQEDFNITVSRQQIYALIDKSREVGINSLALNYIFGSPKETEETMNASKQFIKEILTYCQGNIDILNFFFYPDKGTKYGGDEIRALMNFDLYSCLQRKDSCVQNSETLDKKEIYSFVHKLETEISLLRADLLPNLPWRERLTLLELQNRGIRTQFWKYCRGTLLGNIRMENTGNDIMFSIDDIFEKKCEGHYKPNIVGIITMDIGHNQEKYLECDPRLLPKDKTEKIDLSEFGLDDYLVGFKSLKEIYDINMAKSDDKDATMAKITAKFHQLEELHLIYYRKILN